jgi:hypothetical protein
MRLAHILVFVGAPLSGILGFLMFRFPLAWAEMNARSTRKDVREFNAPKQLAHTRQLGILIMFIAGLGLVSVLASDAIMHSLQVK